MIIAVDAAGGDFYPKNPVEGALLALDEDSSLEVILVGPEDLIKKELENRSYDASRLQVVHAPEVIGMDDSPSTAVKQKKNSSIVVGLGLHKEGKCDAFVSAGNTGALLAASTLILGRLKGVARPTIATYFPTLKGFRLLVDAGANLEIRPEHALQFAKMGQVYSKYVMGIDSPRVGLMNVGEEEEKGTDAMKEIHETLMQLDGFVGNVEGRDIFPAKADVYVTDGVVGNVLLKFGESIPATLKQMIKGSASKGIWSKISLFMALSVLKKSLDPFNYENVGGIPFLGVNGVSVVGHGGSSPLAIKNMIKGAISCVNSDVNGKIVASLT